MEQDGEDLTPFWVESSANRRRRRSSSLCLNSGVLVFLLCVSAVVLVFFVITSVLTFTARIFRPNLVKKSWDSINVVLVLFALVFGFLSRNKNYDSNFDEDRPSGSSRNEAQRSNPSTPHQWHQYSDRTVYSSSSAATGGLRRTFSSYPDLREVSLWDTADDRWRFSDDTQVNAYRYLDSDQLRRRRSWKQVQEDEEKDGSDYSKTIHVDKLVVSRAKEVSDTPPPLSSPLPLPASAPPATPPPQQLLQNRTPESIARKDEREKQVKNEAEHMKSQTPPSPPPPPPPPSPAAHRKHKRTYESISHNEKRKEQVKNKSEPIKSQKSPMVPPPPPPLVFSEKKSSKTDRKRGGSNATKDFLTSLYHQSNKKKKQRQKSVDNFEILLQAQPPLNLLPPSSPPPPPPPPPPPSVFHSLFSSKKGKSKRIPPPPPPPPPPVTAARASKIALQVSPIAARQPPMPLKISSFSSVEESPNSGAESPLTGSESPLIPIPPPPPFKMPTWRYKVQGDYVRIESMSSSRSGSPDLDDAESPTTEISTESAGNPSAVDGSEAVGPIFCPSPDVNTKADVFIARFRAGLKLQKLNSMKQKQGLGLSNLGPESK